MKKRNKLKIVIGLILIPYVLIWYYFLLEDQSGGIYFDISTLGSAIFITILTGLGPYFIHRYFGRKKNIHEWTE